MTLLVCRVRREVARTPARVALAVNDERVVALAISPWAGVDGQTAHVIKIKASMFASSPRERVRLSDPRKRGMSKQGTLTSTAWSGYRSPGTAAGAQASDRPTRSLTATVPSRR